MPTTIGLRANIRKLRWRYMNVAMPPKTTLTAKNLEALGVERLAELLIGIGDTNAARHFQECASLASSIADFGKWETHETFAARLRGKHSKKSSFWRLVT